MKYWANVHEQAFGDFNLQAYVGEYMLAMNLIKKAQ